MNSGESYRVMISLKKEHADVEMWVKEGWYCAIGFHRRSCFDSMSSSHEIFLVHTCTVFLVGVDTSFGTYILSHQ